MTAPLQHLPDPMASVDVPRPKGLADTDANVRVDAVAIRGTDVPVLSGDVRPVRRVSSRANETNGVRW